MLDFFLNGLIQKPTAKTACPRGAHVVFYSPDFYPDFGIAGTIVTGTITAMPLANSNGISAAK